MTNNRIKVEIERATKKAFLITDGSKKGWIQKRWLRDDSTVSIKTFEKACDSLAERDTEYKAQKDFANTYHGIRIDRETEKAIATEVVLENPTGQTIRRMVWFPKSLTRDDNKVVGWFLKKKIDELVESFSSKQAWLSYEDRTRLFS